MFVLFSKLYQEDQGPSLGVAEGVVEGLTRLLEGLMGMKAGIHQGYQGTLASLLTCFENRVSLRSLAQDGLQLKVLLPQPPKY